MLILLNILGYIKVKYFINCLGIFDYLWLEFENLWKMLVILIYVNYDDIVVFGVKMGCVIVIMMIWNCLILLLKVFYMLEKLILICYWMLKFFLKYKIMKVVIKEDVFYFFGRLWVIINFFFLNILFVNVILYCFFLNFLLIILLMLWIFKYIV